MIKYRPSSAAFQVGDLTVTEYPSGCLRYIVLDSLTERKVDIDPAYQAIGAKLEEIHEAALLADQKVLEVQREEPTKLGVFGHDDAQYSGRRDFLVTYKDGTEQIDECKATFSKTTRREFRKGSPKINHLAQLVSYLAHQKLDTGRLIYGYFEELDGEYILTESKEIIVCVQPNGDIYTGASKSPHTASDQLRHMQHAIKNLKAQTLSERPQGWDNKWGSPCNFCVFKDLCDSAPKAVDGPTIKLAQALRDREKPMTPKINLHKPKRGKNV